MSVMTFDGVISPSCTIGIASLVEFVKLLKLW